MGPLRTILIIVCLLQTACTSHPAKKNDFANGGIVWPPPPILPRIALTEIIRTPEDAGIQQGFWNTLKSTLLGEESFTINRPYGIHADCRRRIMLVDTGKRGIHLFDRQNARYAFIQGTRDNALISPIGITEDPQERLYITDSATGIVYRCDLDDLIIEPFIKDGIKRPTGIAYNSANKLLYIVDTVAAKILAYDLSGNKIFSFGTAGVDQGRFNHPTDIAVDATGNIIITDSLNSRIQVFSKTGDPLKKFGQAGDSAGNFAKPKGVSVDSDGHIYVCDALFDTVQVFDSDGKLLLNFGNIGSEPGEFWMPSGIFIDKDDTIFVVDTYNQRVQVFNYLWSAWPE